ncbi:hypothetical protein OIU84_019501 [Salix udensis]|uniref:Uncoupling protein 3 n=1 Tax=Salix udensis TaxID=889485 RepID=A0AAD6L0J1_9ROSI|nr:hypothetical protein OIU84_019501 [Salix udensis]
MSASHGHQQPQTHTKILLTSLSAMVAETATFPIDLTKTRLQLHSSTTKPTNAFRVASEIIRQHGPLGFYQGLSPAILRHLLYTPIRIVGYENLRYLAVVDNEVAGGGGGGLCFSLHQSSPWWTFWGNCSVLQVVASPADLVKVQMQADGRIVNHGLQPRYSGPFDAFSKIIKEEGFGGLWKGVLPNIQRAFLVNMGELACYDHAKRFIIQNHISADNMYAHTLASIMSGLSATALSCPADVVKTRMMNQESKQRWQGCVSELLRLSGEDSSNGGIESTVEGILSYVG